MTEEQETSAEDLGPVDRATTALRDNLTKSLLPADAVGGRPAPG